MVDDLGGVCRGSIEERRLRPLLLVILSSRRKRKMRVWCCGQKVSGYESEEENNGWGRGERCKLRSVKGGKWDCKHLIGKKSQTTQPSFKHVTQSRV